MERLDQNLTEICALVHRTNFLLLLFLTRLIPYFFFSEPDGDLVGVIDWMAV